MAIKNKKKTQLLLGLTPTLLILLPVLSLWITIPYDINGYAEIYPKEKWMLTRGSNGEMLSTYIDYSKGRIASYGLANFERGESVILDFSSFIGNKIRFEKGDTLAFINSTNLQNELIAAKSQMDIAFANLKSQNSPAKTELITEAAFKLTSTEKKIEEEKIIFERTKQLFEKGYTSKQDYDAEKSKLDLLEIESSVNKANLENLKTGVKPEDIALLESEIMAAKNKIKFLYEKKYKFTLTAPFGGELIPSFNTDTLFNLINRTEAVLHMPISVKDIRFFIEGGFLQIKFPETGSSFAAKILSVGKEVKIMNGKQTVFISLSVPNDDFILLPGMVIKCSLLTHPVSLAKYLLESAVH